MTLFAQVRVFRPAADQISHLHDAKDPQPELGWVVFEGEENEVVISGFAADGSTFSVRGDLQTLTELHKPEAPGESSEGAVSSSTQSQPVPTLQTLQPIPGAAISPAA